MPLWIKEYLCRLQIFQFNKKFSSLLKLDIIQIQENSINHFENFTEIRKNLEFIESIKVDKFPTSTITDWSSKVVIQTQITSNKSLLDYSMLSRH